MSLKTSFCNKSIIKSDIRRFWWISALHLCLLLLSGIFVFLDNIRYRDFHDVTDYTDSLLFESLIPFYFFAIVVPVILGVFLFSYLHSGKMSAFAHSIPVLRRTHYVSHIVSGLILSISPVIINALILIMMRTTPYISEAFRISHLLYIVLGSVIYTLVAFSGSVFVSTIVANSVAALIFTFVFGVLPFVAEIFWRFFMSTQLYGFPDTTDNLFFKFLYIPPQYVTDGAAVYLVLSLIFLLSGFAVYRKRNLEINAEIVAFSSLRPVFIYGAAIAGGCFGFSYFNAISDVTSALALIPFGILGIIIATMIVKKSFRVFKAVLKPLIAYVLVTVAIFVATEFDLTGYEKRIPDADKVESVVFDLSSIQQQEFFTDMDIRRIIPVKKFEPILTSAEDIENVTKLHKALIEKHSSHTGRELNLTYKLKNGGTITRSYCPNYNWHQVQLEPIFETDVIKSGFFPILFNDGRKIRYITIEAINQNPPYQPFDKELAGYDEISEIQKQIDDTESSMITVHDSNQIANIVKALKADATATDYSEFALESDAHKKFRLTIYFKKPFVYEDGSPVPDYRLHNMNETYYLLDTFTNTINEIKNCY